MDFWESGMDLKHGDDIYDSFRAYQNKLLREYASMADEFHFRSSMRAGRSTSSRTNCVVRWRHFSGNRIAGPCRGPC